MNIGKGLVEVTWGRRGRSARVTSTPYPIHHALVEHHLGAWYVVTCPTAPGALGMTGQRINGLANALKVAGDIVREAYRISMKYRFSSHQRYAMGQQWCPYMSSANHRSARAAGTPPDRGAWREATRAVVCGQTPDMGTVWCVDHPSGRKAK